MLRGLLLQSEPQDVKIKILCFCVKWEAALLLQSVSLWDYGKCRPIVKAVQLVFILWQRGGLRSVCVCVSQFSFLQAHAVCECLFLHVNISSLCVCVSGFCLIRMSVSWLVRLLSSPLPLSPHILFYTHGHTNTHLAPRSSEAESTDTAEAFKNITRIQ